MKRLILFLIFLGTISLTRAQTTQKSPEQRAMHMTKILQKTLKLTARQALKINRIYLTRAMEMDSLQNNSTGDKQEDRKERKNIKYVTQQQVMNVLNSRQQQAFIQFEKMKKERNSRKMAGNDPAEG